MHTVFTHTSTPSPARHFAIFGYGMPEEAISITRTTSTGGSTVSPSPAFAEKCLPQARHLYFQFL